MPGYHLCSDNYKNAIFQGFSALQHQEEFVDLTLAADGHLVKVHKNIIAVASPYIKALLQSAPCSSPVIFLNNVRHIILKLLIMFIYEGEVDVPELLLEEFLQVGKELHISGINTVPKKTSLVISETTVKKPQSSNSAAAFIRINNINCNQPVEVLQSTQSAPPAWSIPFVQRNNTNPLIPINYESETQGGFLTSNNFVISNNTQINPTNANNIKTGNDFTTGNDLCNINIDPANGNDIENSNDNAIEYKYETGNDMDTVSNPTNSSTTQTGNHFEIGNNVETGKFIITVANPQTTKDLTVSNETKNENDIVADYTDTENDFGDGNDVTDKNLQTGNDIVTDSNLQTGNEIVITSNLQSASHSGKTNSFDYSIKVKRLDSLPQQTVPIATELDKIDANDLKGIAQYSVTERGSTQLILNRFIYGCHFISKKGHRRRWRCIEYRRSHCPAFVETEDGLIVKRKGLHSHSFHDKKIYNKNKRNLIFSSEGNVKEYISNVNKK